jgi:hypothetical protein
MYCFSLLAPARGGGGLWISALVVEVLFFFHEEIRFSYALSVKKKIYQLMGEVHSSALLHTFLNKIISTFTMKFSAILLTSLLTAANAFSPSTQGRAFTARYVATEPEVSTGPSTDPVDKTLTGIDDDAEHDVFDPHAGVDPALTRNNKDEVWVSQVCLLIKG